MSNRFLTLLFFAPLRPTLGKPLLAWALVIFGLLLQEAPAAREASPQGKSVQIGVLLYGEGFQAISRGLRDGLRELGYADAEDTHLDVRVIDGDVSKIPALVEWFLEHNYDLIVTTTTPIIRKVEQLTAGKSIPLLFTLVANPLDSRIVTSLRRPGGNVSGISHIAFELLAKRLQLFKIAFPGLKRIALFYSSQEQFLKGHVEKFLRPAAVELGVELVQLDVTEPEQLERHTGRPEWRHIDGILMLPDPLQVAMFDQLVALSRRHRLPFMVLDNQLLARGGVIGYSPNFYDVGRQAAEMAAAVLHGAKIGRMPVQNPRRISLLVSVKEARRLGLSPSRDILIQADEIIR